jgi:L-ribulose-5-phosphate 3-epimerase
LRGNFDENTIGVTQGRRLPKYQGRYQAHPVDYWQKRFEIAGKIGLDCVEFNHDYNDAEQSPL